MHECAFGPEGHKDLTGEDDISSLEDGVCPLCMHDFAGAEGETVCIECGHRFSLVETNAGSVIEVIPLAD